MNLGPMTDHLVRIGEEVEEIEGSARNGGETCAATPKSAATKHTAAPWEVRATDVSYYVWAADGVRVASTSWHGSIRTPYPLKPEAEANARLIAAAPDLLEALQEAEREVDAVIKRGDSTCKTPFTLIKIRAAIARATGSGS